ncbi:MAG TPA: ABC transporter ATP-binding protein [Lachnospiraceae bacterium]|nr:ABC transporter ATP-binding protein [Lachnospiraceae bacterium]
MQGLIGDVVRFYFGSTAPVDIVLRILFYAGLWRILQKSGVKGWWALVPWAREYQLARCAHREPEGRAYCITSFASDIAVLILAVVERQRGQIEDVDTLTIVFLVIGVSLELVWIVFTIRVFSGLIQVYGLRKRWLWLCLTSYTIWIPVVVWGFVKSYQPRWKVEDLRELMESLATHGSASVLDQGLTVNLKDRTVTEFFQKKVLLKDIHLSIPQGHMVLLLGGSGAGKTTFINAVNGYEKANAEVMLNGADMYTQYKHMQYEVGFVPQSEMMQGKDTVWNTLLDSASLRLPMDVTAEQRKKRVTEVMEIFGLEPVKNNLVEKLSGGQKKRLSISMEFLSNPSLFILDEPDSGLDGVMARELFEQLRKIADTGKIVIVITHTPDRVIDLFDDVIVLAKDSARTGRLAWYGGIEDAKKFFQRDSMEKIVKAVNRKEEGGDGLADEYVLKYAEVQYG